MFLGKLVLLGLALLPVVAFGLIVKNILFDKDKIMPTIEDLKEAGVGSGVGSEADEDDLFRNTAISGNNALIHSVVYADFPENVHYSSTLHQFHRHDD